MKIKKLSAQQFAGIRDKEVSFNDGVNVVFGQNESGKSTLVRLLCGVLFQDAKIGRGGRDFKENAFPADRTDGKRFDCIDGTLIFETTEGEFKLTKEWGGDAWAKLSTPDGIIKSQDEINKTLGGILGYGEGVYREMLLSPQSSAADNLKSILERRDTETRRTLADAVSEAFAESGGVSAEKIETKINEKIEELSGCWNIEADAPKPKSGGGRWARGLGEVLKAWYRFEDAQSECAELQRFENALDAALKRFSDKDAAAEGAVKALDEFEKISDVLRELRVNEEAITRCKEDIARFTRALEALPSSKAELEKAEALQAEKENRALLDCRDKAKKFYDEMKAAEDRLSRLARPEDGEIKSIRAAERETARLKNKLREMNIAAKVKAFGGHSVKITSLLSGKEMELDGENAIINEAVRVEIPGVMEMELAPVEVNAAEVNAKISVLENEMSGIFQKYKCGSAEQIEQLAGEYDRRVNEYKLAQSNYRAEAGEIDYAELERMANSVKDAEKVRVGAEIESDIAALCGSGDIKGFIGARKADIKGFFENYESEEELRARIQKRGEELKAAEEAVAAADSVPDKYKGISDIDGYKSSLKTAAETARAEKEQALSEKAAAKTALDAFTDNHSDDLRGKLEKAKRDYEAQAALLKSWLHIAEVFNAQRREMTSDPLGTLADNFARYLGLISDSRVTAEFAEAGKPDFEIASGKYKLDFAKLSDGTRETVYLAFRLAVLDHLFPDGGGVMALDDPLNDMDSKRVEQACAIIKECAKRHQIIFLTCREEYAEKLGANNISI